MIKLRLTDEDISDIHEALDDPMIDQRNKNRLLVITMHHEGANNTFISACMKLSANTVTNYIKLYRDGGIGELIENRYYCPSSSLEPFMQCIECCFRIIPVQNAKDAVMRIEKIRTQYEKDTITLILDNARYQRCKAVMQKAQELNIELLFLPSYSPNLNLIERLWKLVKKHCLTNRYYESFDKFKNAIDHCLDKLSNEDKAELESLLTLKFQFFTNPKT